MESPKIVLLHCGEEVYPQGPLDETAAEVKKGLLELNLELCACCTIINEKTAEEALREVNGKDFDVIVVHFVSWHITPFVMRVLKEYRQTPILAWATGGRRDAGGKLHSPAAAAGITALIPVLREMGFHYKAIYEMPDQAHKFGEVEAFARVAAAYRRIRGSRIGLVGYADMGLYTCAYDRTAIFNKLGIDVEDYFSYEIGQMMESAPADAIRGIVAEMKGRLVFENTVPESVLEKIARLYCALRKKVGERGLDAVSIKCVNGVTRYMGVNPCMAQSMLAGSDLSVICECDAHGLITTMMMSMLTGQTATFFENYEFFENEILIGTCGFLPFDFAQGPIRARSANLGDFFTGLSNVSAVRPGTMTLARLYKDGENYKMFLTKGEARPPMKWVELGWDEPTPDFPSVLLKLDIPVQSYLENVPGQHIIAAYGDHIQAMKALCGLFGIETVC